MRLLAVLLMVAGVIPVPSGIPVGFFASPGTHGGSGTIASPWDLPTALAATGSLVADTTLWLRDGIYNDANNYSPTISGSSGHPVVIRSYPGEHAKIVGPNRSGAQVAILYGASGSDRRWQDLEVYCSDTDRTSTGERIAGIDQGLRDDVVNCVIHDCGQGIAGFFDGPGRIDGNIIYYNGGDNDWDTRMHNIYLHNAGAGVKTVRRNVIFRASGFNIQYFATASQLNHTHFEGNILFDAGVIDTDLGNLRNASVFFGGATNASDNTFDDNVTYDFPGLSAGGGGLGSGYGSSTYLDVTCRRNYCICRSTGCGFDATNPANFSNNFVWSENVNGNDLLGVTASVTPGTWDNNEYRAPGGYTTPFNYQGVLKNFANWKTASGVDANSTFTAAKPGSPKVFVTPNEYQAGRGFITIMNWPLDSTVAVDFSSVLATGDNYVVKDVNNYYGPLVASGTYGGGTVTLTMGGYTCATPIGYGSAPAHLGPEWNVFSLEKV